VSARSAMLLTAVLLCVGCGYSSQSLIDPQYRTVYVETFDNQSFYRGYEVSLTREIINIINARTHLRIVPKSQAETILTGQIRDYRQIVLTEDERGDVRELQVTITVDMTWSERGGRPIKVVRGYTRADQVKRDLDETLDSVNVELFRDAAEELVEQLEADW